MDDPRLLEVADMLQNKLDNNEPPEVYDRTTGKTYRHVETSHALDKWRHWFREVGQNNEFGWTVAYSISPTPTTYLRCPEDDFTITYGGHNRDYKKPSSMVVAAALSKSIHVSNLTQHK